VPGGRVYEKGIRMKNEKANACKILMEAINKKRLPKKQGGRSDEMYVDALFWKASHRRALKDIAIYLRIPEKDVPKW